MGALAIGLLLAGTSGAVAALGDTLYPAASHAEGFAATLSPTSHILLRLRALHPLIAVTAGVLLMFVAPRLAGAADALGQRLGRIVLLVAGMQLLGGLLNVLLLAPVWMQIVHLLVADLLWIAFVLLGAQVLAVEPARATGRITTPCISSTSHRPPGLPGAVCGSSRVRRTELRFGSGHSEPRHGSGRRAGCATTSRSCTAGGDRAEAEPTCRRRRA